MGNLNESIVVEGGVPLKGQLRVSGSKNATLPILCASLLADGKHQFRNVPDLKDVQTTALLLEAMGLKVDNAAPLVSISGSGIKDPFAPYELVRQMRASVLVLGPLVAKYGHAKVALPGGCAIGARPINEHLRGLELMGATIELDHGYVHAVVPNKRLKGAYIDFGIQTVTGTENLMCAAALAKGRTTLFNAAKEPEIVELAVVLNKMGAHVQGAGTDTIIIEGVETLSPIDHAIMPDRIEAGTYMVAAAITGGNVLFENVELEHMEAFVAKMSRSGVRIEREAQGVRVIGADKILATDITTQPHPGFPTDMQAQFMVLMCKASGTSHITETIFENRFMHVPELIRMGAKIDIRGKTALVHGPTTLEAAAVTATDLRASASLVIAGLIAEGETEVLHVEHIDRGYEHIEEKLRLLGAKIKRVQVDKNT